MRIRRPEAALAAACLLWAALLAGADADADAGHAAGARRGRPDDPRGVLRSEAEGDRLVGRGRAGPRGAVARPVAGRAESAIYDRLLATLSDSHTFRMPAGRLPERGWGTAGLRIGQDGDGYAVKGVLPGSSAERAGLKIGDRILEVDGRKYGKERVELPGALLRVRGRSGHVRRRSTSQRGDAPPRLERLVAHGRGIRRRPGLEERARRSARTARPTATRTSGA